VSYIVDARQLSELSFTRSVDMFIRFCILFRVVRQQHEAITELQHQEIISQFAHYIIKVDNSINKTSIQAVMGHYSGI